MGDFEKSTALKKAYAEIILNTAKEAAARILVSERKALRYQQELFAAKDEALCMLLRLKQTLDSKVNEAEMESLNQQKRIEELEAQLGEAEDIVRDLRIELRETQDELEKLMKDRMHYLDKQGSKNDDGASVEILQENRISIFPSSKCSLPDTENDSPTVCDIKTSVLNGKNVDNKCSCMDSCYVCNPDFASIVVRRKEPDLYRNGCTQRIRALERCLLNGSLSLSDQVDNAKNEKAREGEEGGDIHTKLSQRTDMYKPEDKKKELKLVQVDTFDTIQLPPPRKRKRAARYKKNKTPSMNIPDKVVATCQDSTLFCYEEFSHAVKDNTQSKEDSRIIDHDASKRLLSSSIPRSPSHKAEAFSQSKKEVDVEIEKDCDFQNGRNINKLMTETGQESGSAEDSRTPSCKIELEMVDASAVNLDAKVSDESSTQPVNNKFIVYTCKRKRKKELVSSPDRDSLLDDGTSYSNTEEKRESLLDTEKTTLIGESSRDNGRLAQVARQLISLSEKKWR